MLAVKTWPRPRKLTASTVPVTKVSTSSAAGSAGRSAGSAGWCTSGVVGIRPPRAGPSVAIFHRPAAPLGAIARLGSPDDEEGLADGRARLDGGVSLRRLLERE